MNQQSIGKVRYTHDAMIDEIIANPSIAQTELARMYGFRAHTVSVIVNSDAFKERLAQRKAEIVDPVILARMASNSEKADAAASIALDKLMERIELNPGMVKTADLVSVVKLAVGPKATTPPVQNNLYVVNLPPAATDSKSWLQSAGRGHPPGPSEIIENVTRG